MITLEQQKANRKLWVEALRSGKYQQCSDQLYNGEAYCCLGVLARVSGEPDQAIRHEGGLSDFPSVMDFVGLADTEGDYAGGSLVVLNDRGVPFSELAAIIESEPPGLFVSES